MTTQASLEGKLPSAVGPSVPSAEQPRPSATTLAATPPPRLPGQQGLPGAGLASEEGALEAAVLGCLAARLGRAGGGESTLCCPLPRSPPATTRQGSREHRMDGEVRETQAGRARTRLGDPGAAGAYNPFP